MKNGDYEEGAAVQFRHSQGSIGRIVGRHATVDNHWYIKWVYGTDKRGDPITSTGAVRPEQIERIDQAIYDEKYTSPCGWGF